MQPSKAQKISLLAIMVLAGCSTFQSSENTKPAYESAYIDTHLASKKFAPPEDLDSKKEELNPFYLQSQADYYYSVGESLGYEGNGPGALEAFKTALIYDQKSPKLYLRLSAEYIKLGYLSEGIDQLQKAIALKPDYIDAHMLLGSIYSSMKAYDKALFEYQTVLRYDADNKEAPLYMGALYAERKNYDKAISYFNGLLKDEDYEQKHLVYFYIGKVWLEHPDKTASTKALEAFQNSLKQKPDFTEAVLAVGGTYVKINKPAEAINLYKNFQYKYGPQIRIAEVLAAIYLEQQKYDLAYEQLIYLESSQEDTLNTKVKMALILIEQKNYKPAIEKLNEVLAMVPESDKIRFYLGAVHEELKQNEQAIFHFEKIGSDSQFYSEALVHAAYLYKQQKNYSAAAKLLKKGIESNSDTPQMYSLYASVLDEEKNYDQAIKLLKSAVVKYPQSAQVQFFLGSIYDKVGDKDNVVSSMKKVIELDPNHVQGLNYLAYTYAEIGVDLPVAEQLARKALSFEPTDGFVMDTLGWILFKQGKNSEAIVILEKASTHQPSESIIAEHLGDAYYKQKLIQKAKQMYLRAVQLEDDETKQEILRAKILAIDDKTNIMVERMPASAPQYQMQNK